MKGGENMVKILLTIVALFVVSFAVASVVRGQTTTPTTAATSPTTTMTTPTPSVVVPGGAPATGFNPY